MQIEDLIEFQSRTGINIPHIRQALDESNRQIELLEEFLAKSEAARGLAQCGESSFVVFGSLARYEVTSGSDLDWAILVDGRATSDIERAVSRLRSTLANYEHLKAPAEGGAFAGTAYSHELIGYIGGQTDTNQNITRRMLTLLESRPIRCTAESLSRSDEVHQRVLVEILKRYLSSDAPDPDFDAVPRFLLNDVVRFWRTMCVDFAHKEWTQGSRKYATRHVKLRFSRKLLFAAGMLLVYLHSRPESSMGSQSIDSSAHRLAAYAQHTPLEIVASVCYDAGGNDLAAKMLKSYDTFIGVLQNEQIRAEWEGLDPQNVESNKSYREARIESNRFDEALRELFFETRLFDEFTEKYGVF